MISDPPSYAPNEKSKQRALGAYSELHRKASALVSPGGTLCAASCSSHVSMDDFLGTLDDRALSRSDLSVGGELRPARGSPDARRLLRRSIFEVRGCPIKRSSGAAQLKSVNLGPTIRW